MTPWLKTDCEVLCRGWPLAGQDSTSWYVERNIFPLSHSRSSVYALWSSVWCLTSVWLVNLFVAHLPLGKRGLIWIAN